MRSKLGWYDSNRQSNFGSLRCSAGISRPAFISSDILGIGSPSTGSVVGISSDEGPALLGSAFG